MYVLEDCSNCNRDHDYKEHRPMELTLISYFLCYNVKWTYKKKGEGGGEDGKTKNIENNMFSQGI